MLPRVRVLRSLYVCYLSIADPLVDSQVLAYLDGLAAAGHTIHLLSFEPAGDDRAQRRRARAALRDRGIHWHRLRYHKRPSLPATLYDVLCGTLACAWLVRRHRLHAIHARNHVPAAMALLAAPLAPHRLIFDLRGLMAQEYVDAGRWPAAGLAVRVTARVQRAGLRRAAGIVVLTERVRSILFGTGTAAADGVFVIPCCADVERIAAGRAGRGAARERLGVTGRRVLVYVGKFGGWYMDAELAQLFSVASEAIDDLHLLVITQADASDLRALLAARGIAADRITVISVAHDRLGETLAAADGALALVAPLPSKVASSPTKVSECLAAGLPVIATAIGDTGELLGGGGAGVVLTEFTEAAYRRAAAELTALIDDPLTAERCIALARKRLSLSEVGLPRYRALYEHVAAHVTSSR
jgi:glycosyltransferase involved in cell wall biosynthesis